MFQWYHKNIKQYERVLFGILLAVIVIAFVLSGVAGQVGGDSDPATRDYVIETPVQKYSRVDFESLVSRWKRATLEPRSLEDRRMRFNMFVSFLVKHSQQLYAGDPTKNIYTYAMGGGDTRQVDRDLATDICVLIGAAKQADIRVTEQEIAERVKTTMSAGGGMDMEKYGNVLKAMEMEARDYERTVGEFMLVDKYLATLLSAVTPATEDVYNEFIKSGGRAKAKYVLFDDVKYRKRAESKVSQRALVEYMKAFRFSYGFKKEPQARLEFIRVPLEPLIAAIKDDPKDEELQKYYDTHKEDFRRPFQTCALPPSDSLFIPSTMVEQHDDDHDHSAHEKPEDEPKDDPFKPFTEVRKELIEKVKAQMAAEQAAITMGKVKDRIFELRMQGVAKPSFTDLAKEFSLEAPGTSAWFEEDDVKPLDEQLGVPKAGSPQWYTFFNEKPESARAAAVKTDKADLLVRLIEKTEGQPYLVTNHIREKGVTKCAERDAGLLARKEAEGLHREFMDRYQKVYGERTIKGDSLTDEERAAIRFDSFTTVCTEHKLDVKETEFVSRKDTPEGIPDAQSFMKSLFEIEARGDARVAFGNSGQALVELVDRRPPKADDFAAKRKQLEQELIRTKQGRFLTDTLAEFKKLCKISTAEGKAR